MKNILIIVFVFSSIISFAQKTHEINFEISNYKNDTLLLAYFYGEQQLVKDTLYAYKPGHFTYKGDTLLEPGVYIGLVYPSNEYFQFLINSEDQKFTLKNDINDLQTIKVFGSEDNKVFFEYLKFIGEKNTIAQELIKQKKSNTDAGLDNIEVDKKLGDLDTEVGKYQLEILEKYPTFLTSLLIKANRDIKVPEFEGSEKEIQQKKYYYYKKHFFDNIDLKNSAVLLTPFIHNKIETYIEKLTAPLADSIIVSVDHILSKMSPQSELWRYYVSYFLNKYARSNIIGMDAVYVHMAQNYYGKGLTPWVDDQSLIRIMDNAIRMEGVLIGKTAPKLKLYKQDNTPVQIHDIDSDYLVLLFWKPDCGHCKAAMPAITKFAQDYKDKGVKVVSICTKLGKKTEKCWEGVKDLGMGDLDYNLADEKNISGFHAEYNVRSTPSIFILDKNKKILLKQIPADKLGEIFDNILKEENNKKQIDGQ